MVKGTFTNDTFEKILEFGASTARQTVQSVKKTFDPLAALDQVTGTNVSGDKGIEKNEQGKSNKQNHTPLDFKKLENKYASQDKAKEQMLRNRLFQLVKGGDEKLMYEKKRDDEEKRRHELQEAQQKKQEQQRQQQQTGELPQGKQRRSIFSHKKVVKREQTEVKPASGKQ